jgi:hypothetical protein
MNKPSKDVQIPQEAFIDLCKYFLLGDTSESLSERL